MAQLRKVVWWFMENIDVRILDHRFYWWCEKTALMWPEDE